MPPSPATFTIGEFSKATGLTVKALRFYHDQGILVPAHVDPSTGYRHYDHRQLDTARSVAYLRTLDLPVADIRQLLADADDDPARLVEVLLRHRETLQRRIRESRQAVRSLDQFIADQREAISMASDTQVQERVIPPVIVGGIRMKGKYSDCGKGFGQLGRKLGRSICGNPLLLHYDTEYKEDDADFEPCMPVRQAKPADGIDVRQLPGGRCVTLVHQGPYDQLGRSYATILTYVKAQGYRVLSPTREIYIKGPGMIFRGNPKKYVTEIQMLIEPTE